LDEFAADDGVEAGGRFIEHQQFRLGANGGDERELRALALRERISAFGRIEPEAVKQFLLFLLVPVFAEGSQIVERLADSHPGIERQLVRDVGEAALYFNLGFARLKAEHARQASL